MSPPAWLTSACFVLALLIIPGSAGAAVCGEASTPLSTVQGSGAESTLTGQQVVVEGVVTGVFLGPGRLAGFYLQSAPADEDSDPDTSEGLFIHLPEHARERLNGPFSRRVPAGGERVRVTGRVAEYHGLTELTAVRRLISCGMAAVPVEPQPLSLPLTKPESVESTLVSLPALTLVGQRNLARYGYLTLAPQRLVTATQLVLPGPVARDRAAYNRRLRIILDDGSSQTYADSRYQRISLETDDQTRPLRLGDAVEPFTAILDFRYGEWRLQPTGPVAFIAQNDRPEPLPAPGQSLRLVAFNLENFFNGDGRGNGFPSGRGAKSRADYERQKAQLTMLLGALSADIIAVSEVENDGYGPDSAIADLAGVLGPDWAYVDFSPGDPGEDAIANGILYRQSRVQQTGKAVTLNAGAFASSNRPALAAAFQVTVGIKLPGGASKEPIVVVANHFKSKRCNNPGKANRDSGDGQGCWNARRTAAAGELVNWLAADPTGTGSDRILLMGDFNSYRREDPLRLLDQRGFYNPLKPEAYSYIYGGELGTLDYILVAEALKAMVQDAGIWHANVDEPTGVKGGPWGVSDHDPVWLDLKLR